MSERTEGTKRASSGYKTGTQGPSAEYVSFVAGSSRAQVEADAEAEAEGELRREAERA